MGRPVGSVGFSAEKLQIIYDAVKKRLPRVNSGEINLTKAYRLASEETGVDIKTISRVWCSFKPTTAIAADFMKANALRLAARVVRNANVSEAMDILSRPNIGVLEPHKKTEGGLGGGFLISVQAESCGAVNVAIAGQPHAQLPEAQPALPPAADGDIEDVEYLVETPVNYRSLSDHTGPRGPGQSKKYAQVMADAKTRLDAKRAKRDAKLAKKAARKQIP